MLEEQAMHWGLVTGSGGTWRVSWGHLQNPGQDLRSWPDSTCFSSLTSPGPPSQAHLPIISMEAPLLFLCPWCLSFPPGAPPSCAQPHRFLPGPLVCILPMEHALPSPTDQNELALGRGTSFAILSLEADVWM